MRVVTLTTWNENAGGVETGDHKGRPYKKVDGGYFQRNDRRGAVHWPSKAGIPRIHEGDEVGAKNGQAA